MRRFIRDHEPLGFQIIEDENTIREVHDDKKLEEATESLALTRSNSYTMSREVLNSDLFRGAPRDEDSDTDTGSESTDSTSETVRIHRRTRLDPARVGTSTGPSETAQGAARNPQQEFPDAAGAREDREADEDVSAEADVKSAKATTERTLRRSTRLRGEEPPQEGETRKPLVWEAGIFGPETVVSEETPQEAPSGRGGGLKHVLSRGGPKVSFLG